MNKDFQKLIITSGLNTDEARAAVGQSMAAIEPDCSETWPTCPRGSVLCDCRLRATRACNALRTHFAAFYEEG